ncbi:hypothetical protein [Luteimonas huabeiensis]|uniref:hypothetical protein n=1 Tax=Luteimonas huabeiensis TaxID=1244513 RepID=UPI0004669593|nr:hypothetical protein [Luteimonas huabeiensis]
MFPHDPVPAPAAARAARVRGAGLALLALLIAGCERTPVPPGPDAAPAESAAPPAVAPASARAADDDLALLAGAEIRVPGDGQPDVPLTLREGRGDYAIGDERGQAALEGVLGSVETTDGRDLFAGLSVIRGGSGNWRYVALFHVGPDGRARHADSRFVGDRVRLQRVEADGAIDGTRYDAVLHYLDRAPDEPMAAAPTVPATLPLRVEHHRFADDVAATR